MKNIIILLSVTFYLISCYEDKGNYSYGTVNEVTVKLKSSYSTESYKTTVVIKPEISQSLRKDNSNLEYMWCYVDNLEYTIIDTIGTDVNCSVVIDKDKEGSAFKFNRIIRLIVHDKEREMVYNTETNFNIIKPYFNCWTILHKQDGITKLATVEYRGGEVVVKSDAYKNEKGESLKGEPSKLLCLESFFAPYYDPNASTKNTFVVMTDNMSESGIYCQWEQFKQMDNFGSMVYSPHLSDFDITKVTHLEGTFNSNFTCITDGKLFQSPEAGRFYKAKIDHSQVPGEVYISKISCDGYCRLMYDSRGKRFLYYNDDNDEGSSFDEINENRSLVRAMRTHPDNVKPEIADPNHIVKDQEILYIGRGYGGTINNSTGLTYAFGLGAKLYVYEFENYNALIGGSKPCFPKYHEVEIPSGLTKNSIIETSIAYSGIMFYTSENKLYRFDFNTQSSTVIYTHPAGINITNMKFAKRTWTYLENDETVGDNYTNWQKMGLVFDMGSGNSDFVVLHLDASGKITKSDNSGYDSKQIYTGFGKVKDIEFL